MVEANIYGPTLDRALHNASRGKETREKKRKEKRENMKLMNLLRRRPDGEWSTVDASASSSASLQQQQQPEMTPPHENSAPAAVVTGRRLRPVLVATRRLVRKNVLFLFVVR